MPQYLPLVLGGHSFISQLGNDPMSTPDAQIRIVEECLNQGITWFDTTLLPERIALGRALKALGRRTEATIIAWNFFRSFAPDQEVGGPDYYQPQHIEQMLEELQTDVIDCLVVHTLDNRERNEQQELLALAWQAKGYVKQLGTWHPDLDSLSSPDSTEWRRRYSFMVRPYNITTHAVAPVFAAAKMAGWKTLACSPYVRGWELDKLVMNAMKLEPGDEDTLRARLADHMLRYSLFQRHVDMLIVSMRRPEWVLRNAESVRRGELTYREDIWLRKMMEPAVT
jgi:aryl-alcohol dehydrogenase-like predicted oxidoreductase